MLVGEARHSRGWLHQRQLEKKELLFNSRWTTKASMVGSILPFSIQNKSHISLTCILLITKIQIFDFQFSFGFVSFCLFFFALHPCFPHIQSANYRRPAPFLLGPPRPSSSLNYPTQCHFVPPSGVLNERPPFKFFWGLVLVGTGLRNYAEPGTNSRSESEATWHNGLCWCWMCRGIPLPADVLSRKI